MITNERQYKITRNKAKGFAQAIDGASFQKDKEIDEEAWLKGIRGFNELFEELKRSGSWKEGLSIVTMRIDQEEEEMNND